MLNLNEIIKCPVVSLKGVIAYPRIPINMEIQKSEIFDAYSEAFSEGKPVVLLPQINFNVENPLKDDFCNVGIIADVQQFLNLPGGVVRITFHGINRCEIVKIESKTEENNVTYAYCRQFPIEINDTTTEMKAIRHDIERKIRDFAEATTEFSSQLLDFIPTIKEISYFCDFIASNVISDNKVRLKVLEEHEITERLMLVDTAMTEELEMLVINKTVNEKVNKRLDRGHKEYYISEQIKALRQELGEDVDTEDEFDEYKAKVSALKISEEAKIKLLKEVSKLQRVPMNSSEYGVIANYLDTCIEIPWGIKTKDRINLQAAKKILDRDHDGLTEVKDRILEFLAVRKLTNGLGNQIICLVGPPGTGKTSIVKSVAEAMNRKYVRISLGGVRDESDIRGHRKTYLASMPGRIVDGIKKAGSVNPVMLLDEIDKLTKDAHGDPASALMEVLDAEQNKTFRDHFLEIDLDLSDVMFITTANTLQTIPTPLLDRMEVISLNSYSQSEKVSIAKHHLLPKQLAKHGLSKDNIKMTDRAIIALINDYTHEAGVRNLEREIASLCRKIARALSEDENITVCDVTVKKLHELLGPVKFLPEKISDTNEIGSVNGLAYTELGGAMLKVEVATMPGTGNLELTGSLGNVIKESAKAAVTYIRSHSEELGISENFHKEKDIHIHFPEGAVPKDGPSAGVTIITALVSELTGKPVKNTVAMTGEITLRGNVLPIGGLKEKSMAAFKAGVKTVLIPKDNEKDLTEVDKAVLKNIKFIPCKYVCDVLREALVTE